MAPRSAQWHSVNDDLFWSHCLEAAGQATQPCSMNTQAWRKHMAIPRTVSGYSKAAVGFHRLVVGLQRASGIGTATAGSQAVAAHREKVHVIPAAWPGKAPEPRIVVQAAHDAVPVGRLPALHQASRGPPRVGCLQKINPPQIKPFVPLQAVTHKLAMPSQLAGSPLSTRPAVVLHELAVCCTRQRVLRRSVLSFRESCASASSSCTGRLTQERPKLLCAGASRPALGSWQCSISCLSY